MLLENFYQIENILPIADAQWRVNIQLNAAHRVYEGHFPQQPVLPGVCTLQIIKECAEEIMGSTLQYKRIGSCKFISAIDPSVNSRLELTLTIKETEENSWQLQAEGTAGENSFIKLKSTIAKQ